MKITPWFHRLAILAVGWAILLVWVGAAVTTENVGMAVPDWPLSFGSLNPDGWWSHYAVRLEHGHRILGAAMGLLVLGLVIWAWIGRYSKAIRVLTLVALGAVIFQGFLGGIRVLHVSNGFAVFHGCVAQAFFCLLISIVMLTSPKWEAVRREIVDLPALKTMRLLSLVFVGVVYLQLILGATMRHTHRFGIADDGILTTGGSFFPGFGDFDLAILFSHKAWALIVLAASVAVSNHAMQNLKAHPSLQRHAYFLTGLLAGQIALGVGVILSVKGLFVTGFHVLTGLTILAGAFMLVMKSFAATPRSIPETGRAGRISDATAGGLGSRGSEPKPSGMPAR